MGILKSTLKIESTDLFPTPVSFTVVNNNSVAGNFSGFNQVTVPSTDGVKLNVGVIDGVGGAFVYAQAPTTNTVNIHICTADSSATTVTGAETFAILEPGEILFLPYSFAAGACNIFALAPTATSSSVANLHYFIGEKV